MKPDPTALRRSFFSYPDFASPADLTLTGSATLFQGALRLTQLGTEERGSAWHDRPVEVINGFRSTFTFRLSEGGGPTGGAYGFSFNVCPYAEKPRTVGQSGTPEHLAIQFDTFRSPQLGEETDNFIQVSYLGMPLVRNDLLLPCLTPPAPPANINLRDGAAHTVEVDYEDGRLRVYDCFPNGERRSLLLEHWGVYLDRLSTARVGFGAETGYDGWQYHDILNWSLEVKRIFPRRACPTLRAWWPGDGSPEDIQGGHHADLQGEVGYEAGEVGNAFSNPGYGLIEVAPSRFLDVGQEAGLTYEGWIKPEGLLWGFNVIARPPATYQTYMTVTSSGGPDLQGRLVADLIGDESSSHSLITEPLVTSGDFQHVALTYDKATGEAQLYHNGAVRASANFGTFSPLTSADMQLGSTYVPPNSQPGLVDEMRVHSRALGGDEILAIYDAGAAGVGTVSVTGVVTSGSGATGIPGVEVRLVNVNFQTLATPGRVTVTDAHGHYIFKRVPAGETWFVFPSVSPHQYTPRRVELEGLSADGVANFARVARR
jgi:hypothetical protein